MKYQAWTWQAVKVRIIEMAYTEIKCPRVRPPKAFGCAMPEIVREKWKDAAPTNSRPRTPPTAGEISRMEECWQWINELPDAASRHLIYSWSFVKVRKGMPMSSIWEENDSEGGMLRREIRNVCQIIANNLNQIAFVRLNSEDCALSENEGEHGQSDVASKNCERSPSSWMAPDARPILDMSSPELAALIDRLEEGNERREREARRRAKLGLQAA